MSLWWLFIAAVVYAGLVFILACPFMLSSRISREEEDREWRAALDEAA